MRVVIWTDKDGWRRRALLPDDMPDDKAPLGVPQNVPDVRKLDVDVSCARSTTYSRKRGC